MKETMKMPLWGPYSKKYMGISHVIPQLSAEGGRFDVIVHPTLWNASIPVPNTTFPTGYHPLACSTDYRYFSYRYELQDKTTVYADISFSALGDDAYLMRCAFVNNSPRSQDFVLNAFAALELPSFRRTKAILPEGGVYRSANDYAVYSYARPRPWDTENPDGMFKGMFRSSEFTNGTGLGDRVDHAHVSYMGFRPFGCEKGDRVSWALDAVGIPEPVLAVRYRTVTDGDARFVMNGTPMTLKNSPEPAIAYLPFAKDPDWVSMGGAGIELDFLAVIPDGTQVSVTSETIPCEPVTRMENREGGAAVTVTYAACPDCSYTITTHNPNTRLRHLYSGCLEDALINRLSNGDPTFDGLQHTFSGSFRDKTSDEGYYVNPLVRSIFAEAGETHVEYMVISKGDVTPRSPEEYEAVYEAARSAAAVPPLNPDGAGYEFSVNLLRTALLTNVVYPVFRRGENIIHHTPGKRWDSFYTWDSGFIGLGLLEADKELCRYVLDTYLCDADNGDFAFLLHGSLVPTQFPEYLELLKRTGNKHDLDGIYDKMKRYYEFLRGRSGSSTFGKFGNGLLTAYDYWYSCSGMDDYPAQVKMIADRAEAYSCPCLTTAQVILAGKIMKMAALYLGKEADAAQCDRDIRESSEALNRYSWDEESGYYGYTLYDQDRDHPRIMKTERGENWDKGMDGIYPLIAGAAEGERRRKLLAHLKDPKEMWSSAGISAVDMSASYYKEDGYWNGNVWMSHQWFVWKTMLDNGEADFAFEIAKRALEIWKAESDDSWNTYECFNIHTHRGGWFHQFGGLSAPICIWANAYYRPGTITTGFDVWTDRQTVSRETMEADFRYFGNAEHYTMLFTAEAGKVVRVTLNGEPAEYRLRTEGTVELTLPGTLREGRVAVFCRT